MAQTSTLTIKYNGTPLVGAEVIASDALSVIATTDANGQIIASLPDDYAACILVAIRHASFPITAYIATCILESGKDYEIDIPDYSLVEGGGEIRGIHSHFIAEV